MSDVLFGRVAEVTFGTVNTDGRLVRDLRVKFNIEKTSKTTPNKASISVYNLNPESRKIAEGNNAFVSLSVGYDNKPVGIFLGDVARSITRFEGPDVITEFECGDGEKAFQAKKMDLSFGDGASLKSIISQVGAAFGLVKGDQEDVAEDNQIFENGFVASGPIRTIMSVLTDKMQLEWSIQNGSLQVKKAKRAIQQDAYVLTPETGMIESPKKKEDGIEVKSFLLPKVNPGHGIFIESEGVKRGLYLVKKVVHSGDTHGKEWISTFEVEAVNG